MKRFTSKQVSKWIAAGNLINKERAPKPFPGKAPTRIMLGSIVDNQSFQYIGKPSRELYQEFQTFARQPIKNPDMGFTVYVEFDRGGVVTYSRFTPIMGVISKTNSSLWLHYHPELRVEAYPNWLRYKWKVVKKAYRIA